MDVSTGMSSQIRRTTAGVKVGVSFKDAACWEINSIAGKTQVASDRGFWLQLRNGFGLGRGAGSCRIHYSGISEGQQSTP